MAILPFCVEIEVENKDKNIKHDFSKPIYSLYKYVGTYYQLNFDFFFFIMRYPSFSISSLNKKSFSISSLNKKGNSLKLTNAGLSIAALYALYCIALYCIALRLGLIATFGGRWPAAAADR